MSASCSPNRDEIEKEKRRFLNMPPDEKRKHYSTSHTVGSVSTWQDYFLKNMERLNLQFPDMFGKENPGNSYSVDPVLNMKVSIWEGNIAHLEIDAIVTATNARLCGNTGVDKAIHDAAGVYLKAECASLCGCGVGDAKITGGYHLPAKYVIHTVGPSGENPDKLGFCYRNCLDLLVKRKLRTVAFPCISTGALGYPQNKAAHISLKTVRTFLASNRDTIDRIIFCLFSKEDLKIYENLMQVYFPVGDMNNSLLY